MNTRYLKADLLILITMGIAVVATIIPSCNKLQANPLEKKVEQTTILENEYPSYQHKNTLQLEHYKK